MSGGNKMTVTWIGAPLAVCLAFFCAAPAQAQQANMTFFVTSVGPGKGADLGGLSGADQYCQQLRQRLARVRRPGAPICQRKATPR